MPSLKAKVLSLEVGVFQDFLTHQQTISRHLRIEQAHSIFGLIDKTPNLKHIERLTLISGIADWSQRLDGFIHSNAVISASVESQQPMRLLGSRRRAAMIRFSPGQTAYEHKNENQGVFHNNLQKVFEFRLTSIA
jgi:hypothetical protein